jgi:Fur family transcriptional regulator, ferric uptake regulator
MNPAFDIELELRSRGLRVTPARRSVVAVLAGASGPLAVAQICESMAQLGTRVDLVTVYRTVEALEQSGIVARNDRVGECWRYEIRSSSHRHTITCSRCGAASPLDGCRLAEIERSLEQATGFRDIHHSLQFYGTCPACQS